MSWSPHTYILPWDVAWYWGCVPLPEQRASYAMASEELLGTATVLAVLIDPFFIAASPLWWERRLAAWRGNWQVSEVELEIDGVPLRFYTCAAGWIGALSGCIADGGCSPGDSICASVPPYSLAGA